MSAARITMYLPTSRRIKGAGREGRQYEPAVREGVLIIDGDAATLPDGTTVFIDGDTATSALAKCQRSGWMLDREDARRVAEIRAERRDSDPVRQLRRLAMQSGHGGNGLHRLLCVTRIEVSRWRSGHWDIPADIAAKIGDLLIKFV